MKDKFLVHSFSAAVSRQKEEIDRMTLEAMMDRFSPKRPNLTTRQIKELIVR